MAVEVEKTNGTDAKAKTPDGGEITGDDPTMKAPVEPHVAVEPPAPFPGSATPPAGPAAQPAEKLIEVPKGALVAYRKSGGLNFSSREIIVYPDGRVTYDGGDTAKSALTRAARRMSDAQVVRLRRTLDQVNFFGMKLPPVQQDPDGFVIEIAARLGGKNNRVEVNAASLPGALTALVEQLARLLPSEE
jgi:hypothetical protein